jgi:hypothetical protein
VHTHPLARFPQAGKHVAFEPNYYSRRLGGNGDSKTKFHLIATDDRRCGIRYGVANFPKVSQHAGVVFRNHRPAPFGRLAVADADVGLQRTVEPNSMTAAMSERCMVRFSGLFVANSVAVDRRRVRMPSITIWK